jgi:hypothetical protein
MERYDEIAKVAYELFEREGWQHGKDQEHWYEAERIVSLRYGDGQNELPVKKQKAAPTKKTTAASKTVAAKAKEPSSKKRTAAKPSKEPKKPTPSARRKGT